MISAKEAKLKTEEAIISNRAKAREELNSIILATIDRGENICDVQVGWSTQFLQFRRELESLGYKVDTESSRSIMRINW